MRIQAREFGDSERLEMEERKREAWKWENELRRHNFVGFAHEVLKQVVRGKVKEGVYEEWIKEGKEKANKRVADRKKGGAQGEDVQMDL